MLQNEYLVQENAKDELIQKKEESKIVKEESTSESKEDSVEKNTKQEKINQDKDIKKESLTQGISQNTIDNELTYITPQKKIIMRDRCQPESTITLNEYLYYWTTFIR